MRKAKSKYYRLYNANNMDALKTMKDCCVDSIVTDPPYGLSAEPDTTKMLNDWCSVGHYDHKSRRGFMGATWDAFVPQPLFWKEALRVLKPGGYCLAFFSTRTYDLGILSMRIAGFEVRDTISWIYGSGFPKSLNISKAIDKSLGKERKVLSRQIIQSGGMKHVNRNNNKHNYRPNAYTTNGNVVFPGISGRRALIEITEPSSDEAKVFSGWGTALKPSQELIVLARKPLCESTVARNVLKHRTGGINIDGCRIRSVDKLVSRYGGFRIEGTQGVSGAYGTSKYRVRYESNASGRFPSNVILTHDARCKMVGYKKVGNGPIGGYDYTGKKEYDVKGFVPKNVPNSPSNRGSEMVEHWQCHPDCPIAILDKQSSISKSSGGSGASSVGHLGGFSSRGNCNHTGANSGGLGGTGGASRFFYCAKPNASERKGFDGKDGVNDHLTVKPIRLMRYLVRLVTPPGGIVLDPFMGSGTTGVAAYKENFLFVGIEQEARYAKLAKTRMDSAINNIQPIKPRKQPKIINEKGLFQ